MKKELLILNDPDKVYNKIKSLNAAQYIDTLCLTVNDIENFCRNSELNMSNKLKEEFVEKRCNPPLMASYFYYFIYYHEKLPTQKDFRDFYCRLNFQWIGKKIGLKYRKAFEARLDRFYASIMRDIHFYHLMKEKTSFKIEFTLENDIEKKLDLLVDNEEELFGIQLRVDTEDSLNYAILKDGRNAVKAVDVTMIDFPIDLRKAKKVFTKKDHFYFYDEIHIKNLESEILNKKRDAL